MNMTGARPSLTPVKKNYIIFSMNSSYGIKNFFDYEPEESNNPLLFDNSFKGDEMIRSGERGSF